jgi:hypothetical protein
MSSPDAGDKETTLIPIFLVDQIAPTLRFIEGASSENTPASLVVPVERIGEAVLPGSKFMVRRQWGYNYSVRELRRRLEEDLKGLLPEAEHKALFKALPERLFAISFPSFERDNALLHVNFAHEIAHPLERAYLAREDQTRVLQELHREVKPVITEKDPVRRATETGANVGHAARMRQAALMEVLSDTIAAHVFGPSALFALHEVAALSRSMDRISADLHPPWRFRLRHILKVLEKLDFVDPRTFQLRGWPNRVPASVSHIRGKVDEWLRDLHQITEMTTDTDEIERSFPQKQAYDSAKRALPDVQKFAAESVVQRYTPALFREEVPGLLERLHASLPPNRIEYSLISNRTVRLASILASGWLFKLGELAPVFGQDRDAYVQRVQTLNRLVLKAIQLSEIQTEYADRPRRCDNGTPEQA